MADEVALKIAGLDELKRTLAELPKKLKKRALRNALAAGARIVRDAAKQATPTLKPLKNAKGELVPSKYRKAGTVRDAIKIRTSKRDTKSGDVGVFVNVKPAKGADRGAKSPRDPYYFRFLNYGTKRKNAFGQVVTAIKFLQAGAAKFPQALAKIEATLGPQIARLNVNPADPL